MNCSLEAIRLPSSRNTAPPLASPLSGSVDWDRQDGAGKRSVCDQQVIGEREGRAGPGGVDRAASGISRVTDSGRVAALNGVVEEGRAGDRGVGTIARIAPPELFRSALDWGSLPPRARLPLNRLLVIVFLLVVNPNNIRVCRQTRIDLVARLPDCSATGSGSIGG